MTRRLTLCSLGIVGLALVGCASVAVSDRERYEGEALPRPGAILVYDFAVTPSALPAWSEAATHFEGQMPTEPPSAEQLEAGQELGALVAERLVARISEMGLPGERAAARSTPRTGDLALVGFFTSVDEGSTLKRVVIGFGSGNPELQTHVEGYRMTDYGPEKLGSGTLDSGSGKGPGVVVPTIVTIATANPIGIVVGGAVKAGGELSGRSTIEGSAKRTADQIADELEEAFRKQGWIE